MMSPTMKLYTNLVLEQLKSFFQSDSAYRVKKTTTKARCYIYLFISNSFNLTQF